MLASFRATYNYKVGLLRQYKQLLEASSSSNGPSLDLPQSHLPLSLSLSLGLGPGQSFCLSGGACCGFIPEDTNLVHSTACLMLEHREELKQGEEARVSVIDSLSKCGRFGVRILPDESNLQDIMLQNLSNAIG